MIILWKKMDKEHILLYKSKTKMEKKNKNEGKL